MTALIIEDESSAAERLKELLEKSEYDFYVTDVLKSVKDGISYLSKYKEPDVIFADIKLEDGLSFDIFSKIRISAPVIFTTAYDEYAEEAFRNNGIAYLSKPIQANELYSSIDKISTISFPGRFTAEQVSEVMETIKQRSSTYRQNVLIYHGTNIYPVKISNVAAFIWEDEMLKVYADNGIRGFAELSISSLSATLNPDEFFKVSRQALVNLSKISSMNEEPNRKLTVSLVGLDDVKITISRDLAKSLKDTLNK